MAPPSDVVVVGAGIVGCAVAYELARRGASVQIVDDRPAGMGATQASAGVLAPFIEAREDGPLLELTAASLNLFDAFVANVCAASGESITYQRSGTPDVALGDEAMTRLRTSADTLRKRGIAAHILDGRDVRTEEPHLSGEAAGGLLIAMHGYVVATELTRAL